MAQGTAFGELARTLLGPGELIDTGADFTDALAQTQALLGAKRPPRHLFEATLMHADVLVKVDALRRVGRRHELIEVKSSTRAKEEHYDDCAIQAWVARESGIDLKAVRIGHVNRDFVYTREGDYQGLLVLVDASAQVDERITLVPRWIRRFRAVLKGEEPAIATGPHCKTPYDCPFSAHCSASEDPGPDFPLALLAGAGNGLMQTLEQKGYLDLRELSLEDVSRPAHRNMVRAAKSGKAVLSAELKKTLAALPYPRRYLDFQTIQFTVPRWLGTRPYEQIPFHWSCAVEKGTGRVRAAAFPGPQRRRSAPVAGAQAHQGLRPKGSDPRLFAGHGSRRDPRPRGPAARPRRRPAGPAPQIRRPVAPDARALLPPGDGRPLVAEVGTPDDRAEAGLRPAGRGSRRPGRTGRLPVSHRSRHHRQAQARARHRAS
jgi:hypothetical protein